MAGNQVEFALDRFAADDGRVVVEGRWYGVVGRRFVRPVLQIEGRRRLIAVLDHKPWPADEGVPWVAEFSHDGEAAPARLQVAPDIEVDLPAPGPDAGDGRRLTARRVEAVVAAEARKASTKRARSPEAELAELRSDHGDLETKLELARSDLDGARSQTGELREEVDSLRDELELARRDTERARAETERVRGQLDESRTLVDELRAQADSAEAARGRALVEREELRRELEDVKRPPNRSLAAGPYLPSFREPARRPASWGVRAGALVALALLLYALVWVVSAIA